ncbi:hypothetical protein ACA910_014396 [Epithemia clementina (nom. ined.)]
MKQEQETAETLQEEEEAEGLDDKDGNTAADWNEELSQAELSSVGSVAIEAPPPLWSLVWLGESQCQVPMNCKQPGGSYGMAFCGTQQTAAGTEDIKTNNLVLTFGVRWGTMSAWKGEMVYTMDSKMCACFLAKNMNSYRQRGWLKPRP